MITLSPTYTRSNPIWQLIDNQLTKNIDVVVYTQSVDKIARIVNIQIGNNIFWNIFSYSRYYMVTSTISDQIQII